MCIKATCWHNLYHPLKLHHHGQTKEQLKGHQRQDCEPAQGWNGIQDHQQEVWWDRDNCWSDFLQMEEILNNQWALGLELHAGFHLMGEKNQGSPKNYMGGTCGLKSFSTASFPSSKGHVYRLVLQWMEIGRKCCSQIEPKLSLLASTRLVFEGRKMLAMTQRTLSLPVLQVET